jgi:signal transduction histidine kinase
MSAKSLSRAIGNALEKFRLQAEIRQRNHELEQKNQQLQLKNEEISRFYHTLSHELKTPLTAAREFVSILLDGLAGPLTETQNEYLDIVKDSCDQMKIELNDLLDATRLDTGKLKVDLQPGGIDTILKRASDTLIPLAQNKQIQLIHTTNPDLSPVLIDNRRITQIITNLITNAVKFTQPGGEIRVEANANPTQTEHVTVSVSDTGRGIEPDELARIFERLHQPHRNDTSNESGLGLGLYICRELIHLHGGNIWVESIPQKGSTFFFTVRRANLS